MTDELQKLMEILRESKRNVFFGAAGVSPLTLPLSPSVMMPSRSRTSPSAGSGIIVSGRIVASGVSAGGVLSSRISPQPASSVENASVRARI